MPKPVRDQVIVITGATSGIGLATAQQAAARGARVVLAARNTDDLAAVERSLRDRGFAALAIPADVTSPRDVDALADAAAAEYGRIDTWVNNAAVTVFGRFEDVSLADFRQVLETDFMGQVYGAKAALPYLRATKGALVCVGSVLSDRGIPLSSAYCAAKHALKGFVDSLRTELAYDGGRVRVTLIKPASINTPLFDNAKTLLGVAPQTFPPFYSPRLVANAILAAAQGDLRDVYVGAAGAAVAWAQRLSPRLLDAAFARVGVDGQRGREPKSPDAPNNLYAPLPTDGGLRGRFTDREHARSLYPWVSVHAAAARTVAALTLAAAAWSLRALKSGRAERQPHARRVRQPAWPVLTERELRADVWSPR